MHQKAKSNLTQIKPDFNNTELKKLVTANLYSVLYYNSEVCYSQSLNPHCKQQLLSPSANALKLSSTSYDEHISCRNLQIINNRSIPTQKMHYKHELLQFKLFNKKKPNSRMCKTKFLTKVDQSPNPFQNYPNYLNIR